LKSSFKILLADDQVMFRRAVRCLIEGMHNVAVVGEAGDGLELLQLLKDIHPHLVIVNISMPNLRGLEAIQEMKTATPGVKLLILTMHKEREYFYHAVAAGAEGYLLKEDTDGDLITAIEKLRRGGTYVSPLLSNQMADILMAKFQAGGKPRKAPREPLTIREREIVKLIAEGNSTKEVGKLLSISYRTAQHHRANIMKKLNFKKMTDLVRYAIQKNYITGSTF
jgi:DNA-binding NarL/FixJ family response regulator